MIYEKEKLLLETKNDCSGQMWFWIGSLVGRMAQDGEVPGMPTPTYGRIMNLAQVGQEFVRNVRCCVKIRVPFIYMHMLAALVMANNLMYSFNLGLTVGSSLVRAPGETLPSGDYERMVV